MRHVSKTRRLVTTALLLGANFGLSACGGFSNSVDQAYYTGGDAFAIKGGYTRTIFSTSNF